MKHNSIQSEGRPFVAWRIMADMLESFDDGQIRTLEGLIAREKARREDPADMFQFPLFGGQALRQEVAR